MALTGFLHMHRRRDSAHIQTVCSDSVISDSAIAYTDGAIQTARSHTQMVWFRQRDRIHRRRDSDTIVRSHPDSVIQTAHDSDSVVR